MFNSLKRMIPQTLFARSLLIIVTPALLLQLLVAIFFFDRHWDEMTERLAQAVSGEIALAMDDMDLTGLSVPPAMQSTVVDTGFKNHLGLNFFYEPDKTLSDYTESDGLKFISEVDTLHDELNRRIDQDFVIRFSRDEKWYEVVIAIPGGVMRVNFPERRLYTSTSYIFLLWMIGTSSILFAIAILFMRNQIRPIRRLAMAADRFGRGIDVPAFKSSGAREVRQASDAFLEMRDRIQRQIEQRTAMLSAVSHDLRTPLTRMKLQLEMMDDSEDKTAMCEDLTDMEKMITGYLAFVKGDLDERPSAMDIGHLVRQQVDKINRGQDFVTLNGIEDGHILRIRQNAVERAINNILGNAQKFAQQAWVSLYRRDEDIFIQIDDNGPGIDEKHYADVFKPFYRVEHSRNPETGGTGLGMAIAQDIIHSHGGQIKLETSPHGGLQVLIQLPSS